MQLKKKQKPGLLRRKDGSQRRVYVASFRYAVSSSAMRGNRALKTNSKCNATSEGF